MNNKTKKWTILLLAAVLATGLTACGKSEADAPSSSPSTAAPSAGGTSSQSASPESVSETKQGVGEFIGLADAHTAEIKTESGTASYQLGEGADTAVSGMKSGDQVTFEYVEKTLEGDNAGTQLIITKIEKHLIVSEKEGGTSAGGSDSTSDLPTTKEFTLTLEGNKEQRIGNLSQGEGYALYRFDGFSFDSASNKLSMDIDDNYYVEIEKLPSDYNVDQLKDDAEKELAALGEVRDIKASEINPLLGGASFMLISSDNEKLTQQVIVKEVDGAGYLIHVNMPHTEASEGFGPLAFMSLSSLTNR